MQGGLGPLVPRVLCTTLTISLSSFMGNDCKGVLGHYTLGFCARPLLSLSPTSWGMIARGSWVLIPSGSVHDLALSLSLFVGNDCKGFLGPHTLGFCARPLLFLSLASWGMIARGSWVLMLSGSAHAPVMFLSLSGE